MNDVIETIKSRKSIREYKTDQVDKKFVDAIIEAGIYAATSKNSQPWHFTVLQSKEEIDKLNERAKDVLRVGSEANRKYAREGSHIFYEAPTVIIISYNTKATDPIADISAAIQNMMVAAQSLGLASVWIGLAKYLFQDPAENKYYNLPEDYLPYYCLSIGYSAVENPKSPKRKLDVINYFK